MRVVAAGQSLAPRALAVPSAQENVASCSVLVGLTLRGVSITPRAERWLNMAEDARAMANRMRDDQDGKRIILEIANSYEELAAWAAKTDTADVDGLD